MESQVMDIHKEEDMAGEERSSPKTKGRSLPVEQHYFRFERNKNILSDEEHRSVEKDRHRLRERERREGMTDEQRSLERERRRYRDEQRRKRMSDEQRELEKERRRVRERQRRNNMNDEQRALEMERRRIRERQHRQNMNDEQRSRDRERRRERDKQRRESMNDEQKSQERERRRLYEGQKRGNVTNERVLARRKRREQARNELLINQNDQRSGAEQVSDNETASYSSAATDGNLPLAHSQEQLQVEMTNTSERSSTTTLDLNEGAVVVYNGNDVVGNQNASCSFEAVDGNQSVALKLDNLNVDVTDMTERSSTTTLDLSKGTMPMHNSYNHFGNQNASYFADATDVTQFLAFTEDSLKIEVTNMSERSLTTSLDLNESTMLPYNGVHIEDEGDADK